MCVSVCVFVCLRVFCASVFCVSLRGWGCGGESVWAHVCAVACGCVGSCVCVRRMWFCKVRRSGSSATESVMSLKHNLHMRLSPQSLLGSGSPYLM